MITNFQDLLNVGTTAENSAFYNRVTEESMSRDDDMEFPDFYDFCEVETTLNNTIVLVLIRNYWTGTGISERIVQLVVRGLVGSFRRNQLRWLAHVERMPVGMTPRDFWKARLERE